VKCLTRRGRASLVVIAAALSLALPAGAAPLVVMFGGVRGEGLEADLQRATGQAVLEELALLEVEVRGAPGGAPPKAGCLGQPTCVKSLAAGQGADAILDIHVIQIGPLMQLSTQVYDASNGLRIVDSRSTTPRRGFPDNYSFAAAATQGFDSIRRIPEIARAPAEETAQPPPPPLRAPTSSVSTPIAERDPDPAPPQHVAPDETDAPWTAASWTLAGLGGALLLSGAGAGLWWLALDDTLAESCRGGCASDEYGEVYDQFILTGWAAPLLFGAGAAAMTGGLIGLLTLGGVDDDPPAQVSASLVGAR